MKIASQKADKLETILVELSNELMDDFLCFKALIEKHNESQMEML